MYLNVRFDVQPGSRDAGSASRAAAAGPAAAHRPPTVLACGGSRSSRTWRPSSRPAGWRTCGRTSRSSRAPSGRRSTLAARARASVGRQVRVLVRAARRSRASWSMPRPSGCCWPRRPSGRALVPLAAVAAVDGLVAHAAPAPGAVESRLGLGSRAAGAGARPRRWSGSRRRRRAGRPDRARRGGPPGPQRRR